LSLYSDGNAYLAQSKRSLFFEGEHSGYQTPVQRSETVVGAPSGALRPQPLQAGKKAKVLFITSNGIGLGHLTRLMAIARRLPFDRQAIFLTMSQGLPFLVQEGFFAEYFPAKAYLLWCNSAQTFQPGQNFSDEELKVWNRQLQERLQEIIGEHNPEAVVFDAANVYRGLYEVMIRDSGRPFIWSRRAMWKPGRGERFAGMSSVFDAIVEPGEFAESLDMGWTVAERQAVIRIPPIIFLNESELLDKDEARCALGLDATKTAVLLQLGSGNIIDNQSSIDLFIRTLTRVSDVQVVVAQPPISKSSLRVPEEIKRVSLYPLSKYYRAFDFVISASGYNSYHELIAFAVPTIFVPNLKMFSDDQAGRARYAEQTGVGLCIENVTTENVRRCLAIMLDEERRKDMVARCREVARENGAEVAVKVIEDIIQRWAELRERKLWNMRRAEQEKQAYRRPEEGRLAAIVARPRALISRILRAPCRDIVMACVHPIKTCSALFRLLFGAGRWIVKDRDQTLPRTMFLTLGLSASDLERLLGKVHQVQSTARRFTPVFVTDSDGFHLFRSYRFLFEYIPPEREWTRLDLNETWSEFSDKRVKSAIQAYRPRQVITVRNIDALDAIENSILGGNHADGP